MFELLPASQDPGHSAGVPVADLLEHLHRYRINENISMCAQVNTAAAFWFETMHTAAEIVATGGEITVENSVYTEIGTVLGCSATVARTMCDVGVGLGRFPLIADAFDRGVLDYVRVRTVVSVLGSAGDETVAAIEPAAHAAALQMTPGPLRTEVWRLWITENPEEAAAARDRAARDNRTAYVRRGGDGLSWLSACITDLEGAEADRLLGEIADTVCPADPRNRATLRADGLMALLHGETFLMCRCGGVDCPTRNMVATPRRGYLAQILIDAHTLLGLSATPARLGDGTPIDPELARTLARDATWQAILTELRDTAHQFATTPGIEDNTTSDTISNHATTASDDTTYGEASVGDAVGDEPPQATTPDTGHDVTDDAVRDDTTTTDTTDIDLRDPTTPNATAPDAAASDGTAAAGDVADDERVPATPRAGSGFWARCVARGRTRPAGAIAARLCPDHPVSVLGAGERITAVLAALAADSALCVGIDPTGHGGHTTPPPGALTYRPTRETAALVRATYATCVYPGCTVSSAKCELDHRVPFDHNRPDAGGWTIPENLQPLCKRDHDIKTRRLWTCVLLAAGVILWTSPHGRHRVTLPSNDVVVGQPAPPEPDPVEHADQPIHGIPYTDDELLFEPTWWEQFIGDTSHGPPTSDPYLLDHYRQHQAIQHRRAQLQPAPF